MKSSGGCSMEGPQVAVSVATFRRDDQLNDLLFSLSAAYSVFPFRVILVDNDGTTGLSERLPPTPFEVDYVIEKRPGIAAARNAGLKRLRPTDTHIMFVDDDERVAPDWLKRQWDLAQELDVDVVTGPVMSIFGPATPRWIVRGGFMQRPRLPTGLSSRIPATNNTLVRRGALALLERPEFDESFSVTGGSDTEFFFRLREKGARIAWCDESLVEEDVPNERLTFRWVTRRMIRGANVDGRLRLRSQSRLELFVGAIIRITFGSLVLAISHARRKGWQEREVRYVTLGVGWLGALSGRLVREYERGDTQQKSKRG